MNKLLILMFFLISLSACKMNSDIKDNNSKINSYGAVIEVTTKSNIKCVVYDGFNGGGITCDFSKMIDQ